MAARIRVAPCGWYYRNTTVSSNHKQIIHSERENIQMVTKVKEFNRFWLMFGASLKQFSLGISISSYAISIDLAFVWVSLEW